MYPIWVERNSGRRIGGSPSGSKRNGAQLYRRQWGSLKTRRLEARLGGGQRCAILAAMPTRSKKRSSTRTASDLLDQTEVRNKDAREQLDRMNVELARSGRFLDGQEEKPE
jgi:hypothetical protein